MYIIHDLYLRRLIGLPRIVSIPVNWTNHVQKSLIPGAGGFRRLAEEARRAGEVA